MRERREPNVPEPRPNRRTGWRPRLLLAAASLLIALFGAEGLVRLFDLGPEINVVYRDHMRLSEDPGVIYELVPGAKDVDGEMNAVGMRDRDYAVAKPPGTVRIASLGDSICYGFGCLESQTYSTLLERSLAESAPQGLTWEVLNFGVSGYTLAQSVATLRAKALAYEPDIVLLQYCLNDPMDWSGDLEQLRASLTPAEWRYWRRKTALERSLLGSSRLYALAAFALQSRRAEAPPSERRDPQWQSLRRDDWADYFAALHRDPEAWGRIESGFRELARLAAGRPVLVVIFPIFLELDRYPLRAVHDQVAREAERSGLAVLDLLDVYASRAGEEQTFVHNALHPNPGGHLLASWAIEAELRRRGWAPEGPSD